MSFQDPPSRPRYPALGQYEETRPAPGYADTFDGSTYQPAGSATGGWAAAPATSAAGYDGYQANGYSANGYQANGYSANGYQAGATATMQRPADDSWRDLLGEDDGWRGVRRGPQSGGMLAGALTGFLAVAVMLGIATLVAAFVRSQASPVMAAGQAFINHAPSSLKSYAVRSGHERKMLFGAMYVIIAIVAMIIGMFAHRKVAIGVTGIVLIGVFGAFVTISQPGSRGSDAVPAVIGTIAGIAALTVLIRSFYADNSTRAPARRRA